MNEQKDGKIVFCRHERGFFIIESKSADFRVERFWLHRSCITLCQPDEITVGCPVRFTPGPPPENKPGKPVRLVPAFDCEVYNPPSMSAAMSALSGQLEMAQ